MKFGLFRRALISTLIAILTIGPVVAGSQSPAIAATTTYQTNVANLVSDMVSGYSVRSGVSDPRYFDNGLWISGDSGCWRCNVGPGVAAAAVASRRGDQNARNLAIQTFDRAIADHRTLSGGFGPSASGPANDIETMFFLNELGAALVEIDASLDAPRRQSWRNAITDGANFLINNGNLRWYTNGNVVVGNTLAMAYAYQLTGDIRFQQAYEQALSFAVAPPQTRWAGFGLQYTQVPTRADGADGAGYFAEQGSSGVPGLDIDYVQLQSEYISQIYLVNGDVRALRLLNLLCNQLLTRTNTTTWQLNISGGTRHPEANQWRSLDVAGLAVLSERGGRSDLSQYLTSQWNVINTDYRNALSYTSTGMYYNLGTQPTTILRAVTTLGQTIAQIPTPLSQQAGYLMSTDAGDIFAFGSAPYAGGSGRSSVVDLAPTNSGNGYWLLQADGHVNAYGDAVFNGEFTGLSRGEQAVSISADPLSGGYWIFTSKGNVVARGAARLFGDMNGKPLNSPVIDSVATPTGNGYYMVAADGGVFCFGDANFRGSMGGHPLNKPVRSLVPDADGVGYWLVASDGGVFAFDANFRGSMGGKPLNRPVVGMVRFGNGYLMVGSDGGIFNFSDKPFLGSLGSNPPARPVTAVAAIG